MNYEAIDETVTAMAKSVPDEVAAHLESVVIILTDTIESARAEMQRDEWADLLSDWADANDQSMAAARSLPDDTRGVFVGFPLTKESDEEGGEESATEEFSEPDGFILLVASNIGDAETAKVVLLHEISHALGMDEPTVDGLGLDGHGPTDSPPPVRPAA